MHQGQLYKNRPEIVDVQFVSDERAALKAICEGGVRWDLTTREHGERIARQLARRS